MVGTGATEVEATGEVTAVVGIEATAAVVVGPAIRAGDRHKRYEVDRLGVNHCLEQDGGGQRPG